MVYEYFAEFDKWPNSMADLGVDADEMFSHTIRKISIEAEGVVSILLVEGFGTEMQVKQIPELAMGPWGARVIKWRCTSNLPAPLLVGSSCEAI